MYSFTVLRLIPSFREIRLLPHPSSLSRSIAETASGSSIISLRGLNRRGPELSRCSCIKTPLDDLTRGQFLVSSGGQFFMSPDTEFFHFNQGCCRWATNPDKCGLYQHGICWIPCSGRVCLAKKVS
jgi:hypothetical protein